MYIRKKLSEMNISEYNPKKVSKKAKQGLSESLEKFGMVEPIIWNKQTNNIVSGHQKYAILKEKGIEEVLVMEVDLTSEEELALNLCLENKAIQGEWNGNIDSLLNKIRSNDNSLYSRLRLDILEKKLDDEAGINMSCPCCRYKWTLKSSQARIATQEQLDDLAEITPLTKISSPTDEDVRDVQDIIKEMGENE